MRLIHYGNAHLTEIRSVSQTVQDGRRGHRAMKPLGLWVSVEGEDDWPAWCEAEDYSLGTHPTEVVLAPDANVLHLCGEEAIVAFHEEYGCLPHYARPGDDLFQGSAVHWRAVADRYAGIIIAPYVWSLRIDQNVQWYYPWDCASGCIWDASAVAELRPLPEEGRMAKASKGAELVPEESKP